MTDVKSFLGSTTGLVVCAAAALLGLYLLVYHLNHALLAIPYFLLLACPLIHFLHRGRHSNHGNSRGGIARDRDSR